MSSLDVMARAILFITLTSIVAFAVYLANHAPALFFTIIVISAALFAAVWAFDRVVESKEKK